MARFVIVGGGIAGTQAAESICEISGDSTVTLVAEEQRPFYMRPLLADFVAGRLDEERLWRDFESLAASKGIDLLTGQVVTGIDRSGRTVHLSGGDALPYDKLLVATGVKPRLPDMPGTELTGVTTFSTHADALRMRQWAEGAESAIVVGRGLQGVELARALRLRGLRVTMIVSDQSPWFPALFQIKGDLIEQALEQHGVDIVALDVPEQLLGRDGCVTGVKTREGREVAGEIVGFALDQRACVDFLVGSGISLADGVVVDERLRSTDESVFAAGDVAQLEVDGERKPIGYGWMRARAQGELVAQNMCGGHLRAEVGDEKEAQALYGMSLIARWE